MFRSTIEADYVKPEELPVETVGADIRFAVREDTPLILSFIRELAEFEKQAHTVLVDEVMLEQHLFGEQRHAECLIIEMEGQAAGFALFYHTFSTFAGKPCLFLEDLYIKPQFRKNGLGTQLLQELALLALERDCVRMEWRVLDWNIQGLLFNRKLGARALSNSVTHRLERSEIEALATELD